MTYIEAGWDKVHHPFTGIRLKGGKAAILAFKRHEEKCREWENRRHKRRSYNRGR